VHDSHILLPSYLSDHSRLETWDSTIMFVASATLKIRLID